MPYLHGEPGDLLAVAVPERTVGICRRGHTALTFSGELRGAGRLPLICTTVYLVEQSLPSSPRWPGRTERSSTSEKDTSLSLTADVLIKKRSSPFRVNAGQ